MPGLTEEQQRERRKGITGSEIKTVLAYYAAKEGKTVPWEVTDRQSALALYRDKVLGTREYQAGDCAEQGQVAEPCLLRQYARVTGRDAREYQKVTAHPDYPHHRGTPDAIVPDDRIVEIKTVWVPPKSDLWSSADDGVPADYWYQVQWYCHVMQMDRCDIWVQDAGGWGVEVRLYEMERSDVGIEHAVECVNRFWEEHVLAENPPEPDGSVAAGRALDDMRPKDAENVRLADEEEEQMLEELAGIKEEKAHYEKRYNELRQKLAQRADLDGVAGIETVDGKKVKRDSRGSIRVST